MEDMKLKMIKDILYSNPKYKDMKIGYCQEDDYYLIYHYQENFDIFDVDFHKLMSKIIKEVFYKNGIKNVAQRDLFKRELEEYFPEMYDIILKFSVEYNQKIEISKKLKIKKTESFLPFDLEEGYKEYYEDTEMLMVA